MNLAAKTLPVLLGISGALPQAFGASPMSYPIRLDQVVRAIVAAHPELAGDAVRIPENVAARDRAPMLEAGREERWSDGDGTAHVRVRCQNESVCLPFYASVHLAPSQTAAHEPSARVEQPVPVLRAGEHASMVIDSGRLHLKVPVTCLSSGAVGSTIRVAGPARMKVFEVSVLDGATVRGEL